MADYIIDIWKDGELVQSIAGKWTDDEAPRLTVYYLGYYHAERAQLLRDRATGGLPKSSPKSTRPKARPPASRSYGPKVTKRCSDTHKRTKVERRADDGDQPQAF